MALTHHRQARKRFTYGIEHSIINKTGTTIAENQTMKLNSSHFTKGFTPWNKGIHYEKELKSRLNLNGLSQGRAWNKGMKGITQLSGKNHWNWHGATICECGKSKTTPAKNCRECANVKISSRMKGNKHGLGHKHTEETKKLFSIQKVLHPSHIFKDTKIERIIEAVLIENNISHQKQIPLCGATISDFYLPQYKIAIFCDGCYWHGCTSHRSINNNIVEKNRKQNKVLEENDIFVIRLWEHDIRDNLKGCTDRIINIINQKNG